MKNPALCSVAAALMISGLCPAHAADDYWYTGLGVGYSRIQFYSADFTSGGTAAESKKEFDAGYKGYLGYQMNRNWGAELSYVSLGKFRFTQTVGSVSQDAIYKVTGWGVSAIPTVHFTDNFSLYGRFGGFFSQTRTTIRNANFAVGVNSDAIQTDRVDFLTGIGVQYFFAGDSGARIEFENVGKVGSTCSSSVTSCTGRANAKMVSVNAIFAF